METMFINLDARRVTISGCEIDQKACVGQETVCYTVLPRRKEPVRTTGKVLDFEAYDDSQLWDIMKVLADRNGYTLPSQARDCCLDFFARLRRQKGEQFGNGREARRLFQAGVEELALRTLHSPQTEEALTVQDLEAAARRLLDQELTTPPSPISHRFLTPYPHKKEALHLQRLFFVQKA